MVWLLNLYDAYHWYQFPHSFSCYTITLVLTSLYPPHLTDVICWVCYFHLGGTHQIKLCITLRSAKYPQHEIINLWINLFPLWIKQIFFLSHFFLSFSFIHTFCWFLLHLSWWPYHFFKYQNDPNYMAIIFPRDKCYVPRADKVLTY